MLSIPTYSVFYFSNDKCKVFLLKSSMALFSMVERQFCKLKVLSSILNGAYDLTEFSTIKMIDVDSRVHCYTKEINASIAEWLIIIDQCIK